MVTRTLGYTRAVKFICRLRDDEVKKNSLLWQREDVVNTFCMAYDYLTDITCINENLALLLINSRSKSFVKDNYSFRSNVSLSLSRSLELERQLETLVSNSQHFEDYQQLVRVVDMLKCFVNNLTHFMNYLGVN